MFTSNEIKARVKQQPFVPLRIVMSSGQMYDVSHPDLIIVGTRDLHVGSPSTTDPTVYDQINRLAIMHITALQDLPMAKSSSGNGQ